MALPTLPAAGLELLASTGHRIREAASGLELDPKPSGSLVADDDSVVARLRPRVLSHNEATLLSLFGTSDDATVYELGVAAKLSPSETQSTVTGLVKKALAIASQNGGLIRLTRAGR